MKFQYIQGLEFQLSNSSIFQVFQDVYEPWMIDLNSLHKYYNSVSLLLEDGWVWDPDLDKSIY